ncbi:MAG TPA: cobalt ECF transporter T component CbiQ [Azospirillaceae bacterium]|nr:cobalt ECF transporter T component CbiQ [Azospirillaceae bacterium]
MLAIDHWAWSNRWSRRAPAEKLVPAAGLLAISLALPPLTTAPLVLLTTTIAVVAGARVPAGVFLKVMAVPAGFILTGAPMLALSLDLADGLRIALAPDGLRHAAEVSIRSLAAVSCLAFLSLTTPMADVLAMLRRLGVPRLVLEVMLLTYRLVFVFLERAAAGRQALTARLGTNGFAVSVRSVGLLAAGLFQRSLDKGRRLEVGLGARAWDGELPLSAACRTPSPAGLAVGVAVVAVVGAIGFWLRGGAA